MNMLPLTDSHVNEKPPFGRRVPLGEHGHPVFRARTERRTMDEFMWDALRDAWDALPPGDRRIIRREVLDRAKRGGGFQFLRDFVSNKGRTEIPGLSADGARVANWYASRIYLTKFRAEANGLKG